MLVLKKLTTLQLLHGILNSIIIRVHQDFGALSGYD